MTTTNPTVISPDSVLKQTFDTLMAALGLLALSPLFVVVAVLIKLEDGGPVFYKAKRVGLRGKLFPLYKFRSMRVDADRMGPGITTSGDPRITRIGAWVRRHKVDELPQLLNVIAGDMSLVGPRPEDPRYVALYTPEQRQILQVRPGITSAASLAYRHEEQMLSGPNWQDTYINEVMPAKLAIDLEYLARRNLLTDLTLVLRTIGAMPA
jgi:lipopolysaccharide/colanic/teichoic acid biosynthesis glycosyltransferase